MVCNDAVRDSASETPVPTSALKMRLSSQPLRSDFWQMAVDDLRELRENLTVQIEVSGAAGSSSQLCRSLATKSATDLRIFQTEFGILRWRISCRTAAEDTVSYTRMCISPNGLGSEHLATTRGIS